MISKNIDQVAELWKIRADSMIKKNPQYKNMIYLNYAEKMIFYRQITGIQKATEDCDKVMEELAEFLMSEGLVSVAYRFLDQNFCRSPECQKIRERGYFNRVSTMSNEFEVPKYRHKTHQLPRINPQVHQTNHPAGQAKRGGRGGFRRTVGNRETNPFRGTPEKVNNFNQNPGNFENQAPIDPPKPTPNFKNKAGNKHSNFGYSETDPVLLSTTEESKVDVHQNKRPARKPKPQPAGNAHVFDPSKTANMPPPPKPNVRHHEPNPPVYSNVPQPTHQPNIMTAPVNILEAPPTSFGGPIPNRNPEPVIAATKVKPPTASMKPKVGRPIQRYAPPPRLQASEPESQPPVTAQTRALPVHHPPPAPSSGVTAPPVRGRGAPPMRGRGAPPMGRGGTPSARGGMHAQVPINPGQGAPPGPVPGSIPTGGQAPPPPKIGLRGRAPSGQ